MNRKFLITLLFLLLAGWIAGCAYWYVCKIRKSCKTEQVENNLDFANSNENSPKTESPKIEKPIFSIIDGDEVISESSSNISFGNGTADMEMPDSMKSLMDQLASYLQENSDKNLNITGLFSNENENDSLGLARANSMSSYFETEYDISSERMATSSNGTDELYYDEETNNIIGGLKYEIVSNEEPEEIVEEVVEEVVEVDPSNIDKSVLRRAKRKHTMYYPLTHFDIEPTYEQEKYFKNLKKYFAQNPEGLIQITGHTADEGDASLSNYRSRKYADKVKKYLVSEYDLNPRNFRTKGRGYSRPAASSDTDLGKAANRRIEFSFIK